MINTQVKLLDAISYGELSKDGLFNILHEHGYRGNFDNMWDHLLYAFNETTVYSVSSEKFENIREEISEDEFFGLLVRYMNYCV